MLGGERDSAHDWLGFVTARDRLFQMDLLRWHMAGRLAEVMGPNLKESDRRHRVMGFEQLAQAIIQRLPEEQKRVLDAYAQGVNQGMDSLTVLPPEFWLLGYSPAAWRPEDSLLVVLGMEEDLGWTGDAERRVSIMEAALPESVMKFFMPPVDRYTDRLLNGEASGTLSHSIPTEELSALLDTDGNSAQYTGLVTDSPFPKGSNGWVVGPSKTWDGRAILANDMHLSLKVPNIWYRAEVRYGDVRLTGLTLPGVPLVVAGSNGKVAWGFTNIEGDFVDLVLLELDPGDPDKYRTPKGFVRFDEREETVHVKGEADFTFKVRTTEWGPVLNVVDLNTEKPSPKGEGLGEGKSTQEKCLFKSPHPGLLPKGEGDCVLKSIALTLFLNAVALSSEKPSPEGRGLGEGKSTQGKCLFKSPHPSLLPKGEGDCVLKSTALTLSLNAVDLSGEKPSPEGRGLGEGKSAQEKCLFTSPHPGLLPKGEGACVLESTATLPFLNAVDLSGEKPSPEGQIRREQIWSHGERPQGSGQDSPETLGLGEGKSTQEKCLFESPHPGLLPKGEGACVLESTALGSLPKDLFAKPVAVHWTALDPDATDLNLLNLDAVNDVMEAQKVFNRAGGPPLNALAADKQGNIGWTYTGKIPKRFGLDGSVSRSWADGSRGWSGYISPEELPRLLNPASGFIVNANQRMLGDDYPYVIGHDFDHGYRAYRITERLLDARNLTERELLAVQLDTRVEFYRFYQRLALSLLHQSKDKVQAQLKRDLTNWDGFAERESVGFAVLVEFRKLLLDAVISPFMAKCRKYDPEFRFTSAMIDVPVQQLLDAKLPELRPDKIHYRDWDSFLLGVLMKAENNVLAGNSADSPDKFAGSEFALARRVPGRTARHESSVWGAVNRVTIEHPFSASLPLLKHWLDMPQVAVPGCVKCVRTNAPGSGASERLVVSPGREGNGILHMPGGQSGHPLSPHYDDQQQAWVEGIALPLEAGTSVHRLELVPASVQLKQDCNYSTSSETGDTLCANIPIGDGLFLLPPGEGF